MKSFLSFIVASCFILGSTQMTMANSVADTSLNKPAKSIDINPFADRKRVIRTDHASYQLVKTEAETKEIEKKRIIRNDRVILNQVIEQS